jgi:pimeloyl-ACP methyl ester carboxylesterase
MRFLTLPRLPLALCALAACSGKPESSVVPLPEPAKPLVETEAARLEAICGAGEVHSWEVLSPDGDVLAMTRGRCEREDEAKAPGPWRVDCQLSQDGVTRYEVSTWLDDAAQPVAAQMRDGYSTRYYRWEPGRVTESHLGDARTLVAEDPTIPTWMLPSHALYLREIMIRTAVGRSEGGLHQISYAPDQDALSELQLRPQPSEEDGHAHIDLGGASFELHGAGAGLGGLTIASLTNADGAQVYRRCDTAETTLQMSLPEQPQPSYQLGAGLEAIAVDIPTKGESPSLGAELVRAIPEGESKPQPAALFNSGAGGQDRLGFVPEQSLDVGSHEIHDTLARAGFAVLRYDDRGVGQSELGQDATPGFMATVDDARRAWAALAAHPDVDPKRITIIGHGEGALVASLLAQEKIKAGRRKYQAERLVLLAAPGRPLKELIYDEIRRTHADRDPTEVEVVVAEAKRVHDAALADKDLPAAAEPLRDWMQEVLPIDPLAEIRKVRVPIYAVQGGKDFQVSASADFQPIASVLEARKDGSASAAFGDLDHLFKYEVAESRPGHYRDLRRHVDNEFLQSLVTWMTEAPK